MFGLGTGEIVLILLIILIFFGAKKIPDLAQGLGKGLREFRKATRDIQDEVERPDDGKKIDKNVSDAHRTIVRFHGARRKDPAGPTSVTHPFSQIATLAD